MIKKIYAENVEINEKNLQEWIKSFQETLQPKRITLRKYYDGLNEILKMGAVSNRPNYRVNVNLAKYITDVATSYFIGKPVQYYAINNDNKMLETILRINNESYEADANFQTAGNASVYGIAYQLCYVNSEKKASFKDLDPENTFIVYAGDIEEEPICAIYIVPKKNNKYKVYVYTNELNYEFDFDNSKLTNKVELPNYFKKIPIIEFLNNDDLSGDYEPVTDLIDAISLSVSNMTDDLQSIANAILAISGGKLDKDNIELLNKIKVANLPEGAAMEWVVKNINPEATKEHVQRCLNFLFQIAQVPDLTDDAFGGNISGIAIKYKIWGLKQLFATKEAKFRRAIFERIKTVLNYEALREQSTFELMDNIELTFFENTPETLSADLEVSKLKGIVSDLTLFKNMNIVKDPEEELQQIKDEEADNLDTFQTDLTNGASN